MELVTVQTIFLPVGRKSPTLDGREGCQTVQVASLHYKSDNQTPKTIPKTIIKHHECVFIIQSLWKRCFTLDLKQPTINQEIMPKIIIDFGNDILGRSTLPEYSSKVEAFGLTHTIKHPVWWHGQKRTCSEWSQHGDLIVTRLPDRASPKLGEKCSKGENLPNVKIITFRNLAGGEIKKHLILDLQNVKITRVSTETEITRHPTTGESVGRILEYVALNYDAIQWSHEDGNITASYDVKTKGEYTPPGLV